MSCIKYRVSGKKESPWLIQIQVLRKVSYAALRKSAEKESRGGSDL
jgi:hypothetical protein